MALMTSSQAAQNMFDKATAAYKGQLTSEEFQRLLEISNLNHLVVQARGICRALKTEGAFQLEERASKLPFSLMPFERTLQGVCKLPPAAGDLIWGSVSFVLEIAENNANVLEEVLGFLLEMADDIRCLQIIDSTFNGSDMVSSVTEMIYIAIVEFWLEAVGYYRGKLKKDIVSRMRVWVASSGKMAKEFTAMKEKINSQEASLYAIAAAQDHVDDDAERVGGQQKELVQWINATHYARDLTTAEKPRYEGTCEWLRDKREYKDWMKSQQSALLVIYGSAGVGKTVLTSWLINEVQSRATKHVAIYHYFKETDDGKNTILAATRSLLAQVYGFLSSFNHYLVATLQSDLKLLLSASHVEFDVLWKILSTLLLQYSQLSQPGGLPAITIILDAMDECRNPTKLIQNLRKLVHSTSNKLRVAVTARKTGDHVDEFRRVYPGQVLPIFLEITRDDVKDDIAAFVRYRLFKNELLGMPKYLDLRDRTIAVLSEVKNHHGIFLWAFLMCREVDCYYQASSVRKLLDHIPKGLDGMYARICQRVSTFDDVNRELCRVVLRWIVVSRRPMTFAELEEAIKISTANGEPLGNQEFFDSDGRLNWSRRDIVRSCGDLVRYSGIISGDTFSIVHLSARQFFFTHSSKLFRQVPRDMSVFVEPFLLDIQAAKIDIGTMCVDYIVSTSSDSSKYLAPPISFGLAETTTQRAFRESYPLFDYAGVYWTEFVINVLQSQTVQDADKVCKLLGKIVEFIHSPASVVWLEELLRLTYIEFLQHTIRRFVSLDKALVPPDVLHWFHLIMRTLLDFFRTLSSHPQMIRLCVLQLRPDPLSNKFMALNDSMPPLEFDGHRSWIRYDPVTDNLFTSSNDFTLAIKCQAMTAGIRSSPLPVLLEKQHEDVFFFHSAALSTAGDFVAVVFTSDRGYLTTCWNIHKLDAAPNLDDWATLVFSDYALDKRHMFTGQGVAFRKDSTVITPGGIFSLPKKKCIERPINIYDPDPALCITDTWFSGSGEHIARIGDNKLEVLDTHGTHICKHEFGNPSALELQGFSDTGRKVVLRVWELAPQLVCYLVNEQKEISMSMPSGTWDVSDVVGTRHAAFTKDEGKFVAVVGERFDRKYELVAVWSFLPDENGSHRDYADMIYIFKSFSFIQFNLVPGVSEDSNMDVIIVETSGNITKRPLDLELTPQEKEPSRLKKSVRRSWVFKRKNTSFEMVIWSLESSGALGVERWTFEQPLPKLISRTERLGLAKCDDVYKSSPDGKYLVTQTCLVEARVDQIGQFKGLYTCAFCSPGKMQYAAFSADDAFLACLYADGNGSTVYVFSISKGPEIMQRASFAFGKELSGGIAFCSQNYRYLAIDRYLMRWDDNRLVIKSQLDDYIHSFSECGTYYYNNWALNHYRVPETPEPVKPLPTEIMHPTSLKIDDYYIYTPHVLRLWWSRGVVILNHKLVNENDDAYRSRVVCVLPDSLTALSNELTLIWPEKGVENLKIVAVLDGVPKLMDTGAKKAELMNEEGWFSHR